MEDEILKTVGIIFLISLFMVGICIQYRDDTCCKKCRERNTCCNKHEVLS